MKRRQGTPPPTQSSSNRDPERWIRARFSSGRNAVGRGEALRSDGCTNGTKVRR